MTEVMRDETTFTVAYDGEALREHTMNVRDLAPALLGLADMVQGAHEVLNPSEEALTLSIRATGEGSFKVDLIASYDTMVGGLVSAPSLAAATVITFVTGSVGLINYVRHRKSPQSTESREPDGSVTIVLADGTTLVFPPEVSRLYVDEKIRRGLQSTLAPLSQGGIDILEIRPSPGGDPTTTVTSGDLPQILPSLESGDDDAPLLIDQQFDQLLTIASLNFQPGRKWRLSDGNGPAQWMSMTDPVFLDGIDSGRIAFRKGDRILGRVWLRQWEGIGGKIESDKTIIRVIRHLPSAVTEPLIDILNSEIPDEP